MKLVILAGGRGTRLEEETAQRPKPMVEIGGRPILWHIIETYAVHGVADILICAGYRGHVIAEFFSGAAQRATEREGWKVRVIDTGLETMTGGRLRRIRDLLGDEPFHLTYGDGLSDVNIRALTEFHAREGALVTLTAVPPPPRFGAVALSEGSDRVHAFGGAANADRGWINGGFFVVEPSALDLIEGDASVWELTLERLARERRLAAYRHRGFWYAMDTLHDRNHLEELWASGAAPWRSG
jgi:glucose-1-phosphate cytidylyltransferase